MRLTAAVATLTILVVLFGGMATASEVESGNQLYELLASESPHSQFVGQGYILGVMDTTHSLNRVWHLPVHWTIPPAVTNGEIFKAVKKYLEQHPEERDKTAYVLVNMALGSAFPPKK
ncbi:MAG: Rap1a/Tai family immunity protein [Syntrophobacterales bacterium]